MSDIEIFSNDKSGSPARKSYPALRRDCLECGKAYTAKREASLFCSPPCRTAFTNRRFTRGALLYDLYMAFRFERADARKKNVMRAMNRLASNWRQEDHRDRAGRRSWGNWREYLAINVHLMSTRIIRNILR